MKVLDKGYVDLVDHMGSDLTVCNAARVSFAKETDWVMDEDAVTRLAETGSTYHKADVMVLSNKDKKLINWDTSLYKCREKSIVYVLSPRIR